MVLEIKFRAWDIKNKRYYYDIQSTHDENIGDSFQNIIDSENFIVEQYTGLKDRNGVDIYGNDVLKSVGGNTEVVIYVDGRFEPVCWYDEKTYEVVGNIHKNQDLLYI